jgi:hypothetical protein
MHLTFNQGIKARLLGGSFFSDPVRLRAFLHFLFTIIFGAEAANVQLADSSRSPSFSGMQAFTADAVGS